MKMETSKDLLDFVFEVTDAPLGLEKTRQKYIQAHKCLNIYLGTGLLSEDKIKESQNKIDEIIYIHDNKKKNQNSY